MPATQIDPRARRLLDDADLCVKCGLCLPHCPTYQQTQHEGDSPRGRITLVQGLVKAWIEPSPALHHHLDGCLSCRTCEVVCPAKVPFSRVLDGGRAELEQRDPAKRGLVARMPALLVHRGWRAALRALLGAYRHSGLQRLVRGLRLLGRGSLARLESTLPEPSRFEPPSTLPPAGDGPAIALFEGCVSDVFERDALSAATLLLQTAGYRVERPSAQGCCGALHQHAGRPEQAAALAQHNVGAFADCERIATITSGCGACLRDYADLAGAGGAGLAARTREFGDWLWPRAEVLRFRPLPLRALLHLPCTAANVMKSGPALRALLARIPDLELQELDPAQHCCGAAGTYFLTQPDMADRLLARKLEAIERLKPDLVLSSNIGCSLHLIGGLTRSGRHAPAVRHPAVVLAQQLEWPPPRS